jgi:hypothetical protein
VIFREYSSSKLVMNFNANLSIIHARFEVLAAMKIQVAVFCVVTTCSDVVGYQRFGRPRCMHLQGEENGGRSDLRPAGIIPHQNAVT